VLYRRRNADRLRVVPLDGGLAPDGGLGDFQDDPENLDACARYEITMEPIA
jgi:hypothetical protein